jgi:hypothetical protein
VVRGAGALKLTKDGDDGNKNSGGITFNLALFDANKAGEILKRLSGSEVIVETVEVIPNGN